MMDFSKLENNIIDMIKEEQIKLGYREETIRLYYPLLSLNRFLGTNDNIEEMVKALQEFIIAETETFGLIEVSNQKDRFCFKIPPKGSAYVHDQMDEQEFIFEFIKTIEKHGCTIDEIKDLFLKYSGQIHFEKTNNGEFDYLIYFENGVPDHFRYCISDEGCHLIYHRYTPEDYEDFQF